MITHFIATPGRVVFHGIDADGDVLTRLSCGHLVGYAPELFETCAKAGAGAELRCPARCVSELIELDVVQRVILEVIEPAR